MIYGRFGGEARILRRAQIEDVRRLDGRRADAHDKRRIADGCYVVAMVNDTERLYDVAFLRADGGLREIMDAVERAPTP